MKALVRLFVLMGMMLLLQACADMGMGSSTAEPVTAPPSEIFYDQFSDIPIPSEMSVDRKRSFVSLTQDGMKIGLITVSGRVDIMSLNSAMIHNMARNGWSLRAATTGLRTMQIYEKGLQYAVIYTYEETFSTVMEVWGAQRLGDGAYMPATSPQSSSSSFVLEPTMPDPIDDEAPIF